jgi:hypothetical protein
MVRLLFWFAASMAAICHAQMTPLRYIVTQPRAGSISILSIHFQELNYGHEGPGYFSVQHAPYGGKQALVEVMLYGQDAIRSVQFELVDRNGLRLATPVAVRVGNADSDQYWLQLDVPLQPFRFGIKGEDFRGQPFHRVDKQLYTPIEGNVPTPTLPPDLPPARATVIRRLLDVYANDVQARFEAARQAHPDGIIVPARAEVLEAEYEPLFSSPSNEIGLRLHLAVRFGTEGDYAVTPVFFSQYENSDWRQITLQVLDGSASPRPTNDIPADMLDDVLRYGGAAHYLEGQVYRFQFDLAPNYVIRNDARTRYCINSEYYRTIGRPQIWNAVEDSAVPVKYRVSISSLGFEAETRDLPPQRAYLESFRREGSSDCGPTPTNRF